MPQFLAIAAAALLPLLVFSQPFEQNLYFGLRNNSEVTRLQEFLRDRGYFSEPISTGNYFQKTLEAVKKFQKANGLPDVGGYFGPQSRTIANRIISQFRSSPSPPAAPASPVSAISQVSPYKGKLFLRSVRGGSTDPLRESVTIENRTKSESVSITGFRIQNVRNEEFFIPKGHELPGFYPTPQNSIVLKPRDRAVVTVGVQQRRMDFRENLCTGYFDQYSSFAPSLSHECPAMDTRGLNHLSDKCLKAIGNIVTCREPQKLIFLDNTCVEFIQQHFTYAGCVRDYRDAANFYSNRWFVWMQRDTEFFRERAEKITLKDQNGLVVDEYNY